MSAGAVHYGFVPIDRAEVEAWAREAVVFTYLPALPDAGRLVEAKRKTHQRRRLALDVEIVAVLSEHRERCEARVVALGVEPAADGFVFSSAPDGSTFPTLDT